MRKLFFFACFAAVFAGVFLMTRSPFPDTEARPARGERLSTAFSGGAITYYAEGYGPTIVLMASAGREASDFNELVGDLVASGYRTIMVEAPGINGTVMPDDPSLYSFADQVRAVINAEAPDSSVFLIGHAFGNRVARATGYKYSETIAGTILIAAGGQNPIEPTANAALKNCFNPLSSFKKRLADIEYAFFADGNEIPDYWQRGWHTKTAVLQGKATEATPNTDWQAGAAGPMLVIQADSDRIAPKKDAADVLKKQYPDRVSVVTIENAGHALLPEQPAAISEAVLEFLATHHRKSTLE